MAQECSLKEKLIAAEQRAKNAEVDAREAVKGLLVLSELLRDAYVYYKLATDEEKEEIIRNIFSEITLSDKSLEYKAKDGFRVIDDLDFAFGGLGRNRTCISPFAGECPIH